MRYAECSLIDKGYVDGQGQPLASIEDRDNRAEPFSHLGIEGYPEGAVMCLDAPDKSKSLVILEDESALPANCTEILAGDVPDLLAEDYGWPQGTVLGPDGLPQVV